MPSGKQILLADIQRFSQKKLTDEELSEATERLRVGLLLHGSTPDSAWPMVEKVGWMGGMDGYQGPGLVGEKIFLLDLLRALLRHEGIPENVREEFPDLSPVSYRSGIRVIWLLLSQLYFFEGFEEVENGGVLDKEAAEKLIKGCQRMLHAYREDPEDYLGYPVEHAEKEI